MVAQKYRWDFIGLSTDEKPTAATSPKVTDGSTFYCSDNSKLYVWYKDQWYERKALGGGGGGGTSYTAGYGIDIDDDTISVDTTDIHSVEYVDLTVTNITSSEITVTPSKTPTEVNTWVSAGKEVIYRLTIAQTVPGFAAGTYLFQTVMAGSTGVIASALATPDTISTRGYIFGQGTNEATGTIYVKNLDAPAVVQTTGTSTTDVMSQNAVSSMVFADPGTDTKIKIGAGASHSGAEDAIAIGPNSSARSAFAIAIGGASGAGGKGSTAIGRSAYAPGYGQIALGAFSGGNDTTQGVMFIGPNNTYYGYNNTKYRLLTGLYDGQSAHDAVTVGQVNSVIDAINTALSTNIPHIGA